MRDWWIALRSIRRKSASTRVATVILAGGIGAVTVTLSLGYILVARPLPWKTADRVIVIRQARETGNNALTELAPANFVDLKESTRVLESTAAWVGVSKTLHGGHSPESLSGVAASASLFALMGITPQAGRYFSSEERSVAVISEDLWMRQFDGNMDVLGKAIELDGQMYQIIGVLPHTLAFPERVDFWVPLNSFASLFALRRMPLFSVAASLRANANLGNAQTELDILAARLAGQYPKSAGGVRFTALPLRRALFGDVKPVFLVLLAASAFLLVVACMNVMTILLSAALERRHEIAVQLALGASRARLRSQFLREGLLLSGMAGVLSLVVTPLLFHFLRQMLPHQSILYENLSLNGIAFLFAGITAFLCGVTFASIPLLLQTRTENLAARLAGGSMHLGNRGSITTWSLLVVSEIALTTVLCIDVGLLEKSLWRLTHSELGFDPANVLTARVSLPAHRDSQPYTRITMADELLRRLAVLPGIESGGIVNFVPLGGNESQYEVILPPGAVAPDLKVSGISVEVISGDYFRALRIPVQRGRLFQVSDDSAAPRVCLINQVFADTYFAGSEPIGQTIAVAKADEKCQVVGIVGNVRGLSIAQPPSGTVYLAYAQAPWAQFDIVLRTRSTPENLTGSVQSIARAVDPELVFIRITTIEGLLKNFLLDRRLRTSFLALYAVLCILLAGTGLYAVIAYAAQQRRREIALRMALGATRSDIFRLILRQGAIPVGTGLAAGIVLSVSSGRMLAASLYGVSPDDFTIFLCVGVFVCLLGIGAASIPASRACNLDPAYWLRDR
jgi:predicted permease